MSKGERISQFVRELEPDAPRESDAIADNPFYRAFFRLWNEQRYYEAHDVLEHVWLDTKSDDAQFFKGLIQAAGGFVHLQKHYEQPAHRVHGRRLAPAVRLFRLAERNLTPYAPARHRLDVAALLELVRQYAAASAAGNPWTPTSAPQLQLKAAAIP